MTTPPSGNGFLTIISDEQKVDNARQELLSMIQEERSVGDLIRMDYNSADVLVHDHLRQRVNGIPYGCLLIATRLSPSNTDADLNAHQTSFLLLRAIKSSSLPNEVETQRYRLEAGQRASQTGQNWDDPGTTDQFTLHQMRFAGLQCNILGTFRMYQRPESGDWELVHGGDIDNFYAGQGMKIYKPSGPALERIVNFFQPEYHDSESKPVRIGRLRYAASIHDPSTPESVPIVITPESMIAQRTAFLGMTRTGKSNTAKIIISSVFSLRLPEHGGRRVGQLIFDLDGEYANANPQDQGCIRNLANIPGVSPGDVVTYGMYTHPNDPQRRITRFNFYGAALPNTPTTTKDILDQGLEALYQGKEIITEALLGESSSAYVKDFVSADLVAPADVNSPGPYLRFRRAISIYRGVLRWSGFPAPPGNVLTKGLFSQEIRSTMQGSSTNISQYANQLDQQNGMTWDNWSNFCEEFATWVDTEEFKNFDQQYAQGHGNNWSDPRLLNVLRIFANTGGHAIIQRTVQWHDQGSNTDYANDIVNHLRKGRLVIVDQVVGSEVMKQQAANRIMSRILNEQQHDFTNPQKDPTTGEIEPPPPVIIYVEEAHTILPKGGEKDTQNIWARAAKEGAKYNIGLAYATQEPSSIMSNILTNTENWFVTHLNNTGETRELARYNDFADFTDSIIKVKEIGFVMMRTLSNKFTLPVQIDKFEAPAPSSTPQSQTNSTVTSQGSAPAPQPAPNSTSAGSNSTQQPLLGGGP